MVPVLERELIKKKGWITMTEVMDYYTIAQVTPGIIAVNISTFIGYKRRGAAGGGAATVAFILPGVVDFAFYQPIRRIHGGSACLRRDTGCRGRADS